MAGVLTRSLFGAAALAGAPEAFAQTAQADLGATITITAGCTVTGGTINFGTQSTLGANIDRTGAFSVTCTNTTPYTISLDAGDFGPSVTARRMRGGASSSEFVSYSLYTDPARLSNWGSTVGTDTLGGTGNGSAQSITVYGRVPPQSIGSPGSYSDTVTITIAY